MLSVRRKAFLAGAAVCGAASIIVGSGAWACTDLAFAKLSTVSGAPGSIVEVTGTGFDADGRVEIRLNSTGGRLLGGAGSHSFTTTFAVPDIPERQYFIVVLLRKLDGGVAGDFLIPFDVVPPEPAPGAGAPPPVPVDPGVPPPQPAPNGGGAAPPPAVADPAPAQAVPPRGGTQAAPAPPAGRPASGGTAPSPAVADEPGRTVTPDVAVDASPTAAPASTEGLTPAEVAALPPDPGDFWSGVERSGAGSLTAPTAPEPDRLPGLAVGLFIVAGVALVGSAALAVPARRRRRARV